MSNITLCGFCNLLINNATSLIFSVIILLATQILYILLLFFNLANLIQSLFPTRRGTPQNNRPLSFTKKPDSVRLFVRGLVVFLLIA
jgi:hypothetical protein